MPVFATTAPSFPFFHSYLQCHVYLIDCSSLGLFRATVVQAAQRNSTYLFRIPTARDYLEQILRPASGQSGTGTRDYHI